MRWFVLVLFALVSAPALSQEAPSRVEVILADFSFAPETIRLNAGHKVTLHLENRGSGGHNFAAPQFFAAAVVDPVSKTHVRKGKVEVKKGEAIDIILTPVAGDYRLKCTHFLHSGFGMKGKIVVQ